MDKVIKKIGEATYLPLSESDLSVLGLMAGQPVTVAIERGRITIAAKPDSSFSRTLDENRRTRKRYARTLEILRDA